MSEPAAKRPSMDFDEFERRLRTPEPAPQGVGHDPLAELARLVDGNKDPYAEVFGRPASRANLPGLRAVQPEEAYHEATTAPAGAPPQAPAVDLGSSDDWQIRREEWPPAFQAQQSPPPAIAAPPVSDQTYDQSEADYMEAPAPKKSRKAFYLMAASLAAVAAGIGATVLTRGGSHTTQDAPIIKAAQGPMKVQPEATAASSEPSRTASVLDKGGDKLGASKIVNREEQPIDIVAAKAARPIPPAAAPAPAATSNLFPEPRRVRTVPVRPDGSLMTDATSVVEAPKTPAPLAATPTPTPRPTSTASITPAQMPKMALPAATSPTPTASAPQVKTTTRVSPTDTTASTRPAAAVSAKPIALAGANPSALSETPKSSVGGGFAVQLAAAGSDAEAREKAGKFAGQFAGLLGGRRPAVVHGEANGKQVYRVRVTGLSREDATSMCGKIKLGGGACFVAAN